MRILKFEASYWNCFKSYDNCLLVCVSAVCLRNLLVLHGTANCSLQWCLSVLDSPLEYGQLSLDPTP